MAVNPTNGYCTGDELKNYLATTAQMSSTDDSELEDAINAGSRTVDQYCRRRFYADGSATARTYYPHNLYVVKVDDISTTTGLVVKTDTSDDGTFDTTWDAADYQLEPLNGVVDGVEGWPYTRIRAVEAKTFPRSGKRASVEITADWGWAAIPASITQAALILSAEYFKLKDAPFGVAGFGEFGAVRVRDIPQVARLLDPYVKNRVMVA